MGRSEVLVATAGITPYQLPRANKEIAFTAVLDTTLTGAYRVAKRAVRGMIRCAAARMSSSPPVGRPLRLGRPGPLPASRPACSASPVRSP